MNENSEKELLKQDLNNQENPEEIKKFIEDVELMGENEDIVELAKKKLEEILVKANTIEKTNESQISQVESMGGSTGEIEKRTEGIDKQIEEVKTNATEEIEKVKNENSEEKKEKVAPITEKDAEIKNLETQTEGKTEEVKTETQEKTAETQSKPEVKNTGMTEAEKEESKKIYEKHQEWEKMREKLRTEYAKSQAPIDYFISKNDNNLNLQQAFIKQYEAHILLAKSWIQEAKEEKSPNISWIEKNNNDIKSDEEMIEFLKTTKLYNNKDFSEMRDKMGITSPSELVYKYKDEIKKSIKEDEYNLNPHKFDKLNGLIDIAKKEKNNDLLNSIKGLNLEFPEEIKTKLNS